MKNIFKVLLTFLIPLLFFMGCEDKPLPFEPDYNTTENNSLFKRILGLESESIVARQAAKFIEQATEKIAKAEDKYAKALDLAGGSTAELDLVDIKIFDAKAALVTALDFYNLFPDANYIEAINSAKLAKELASEALDILEDIDD